MRLRKAKEAGKQTPNTRKKNTSHKDGTSDKEEPEVTGKLESQGDQIAREQDRGTSEEGSERKVVELDSRIPQI